MSLDVVGQRCMSEREPELGLGVVTGVDSVAHRMEIAFPATVEKRLYALGTPVLKRVQFRAGETITTRDGASLVVERAPAALKAGFDVWGDPGNGFSLMRALKEQFDPRGTLNPGRYVGGL